MRSLQGVLRLTLIGVTAAVLVSACGSDSGANRSADPTATSGSVPSSAPSSEFSPVIPPSSASTDVPEELSLGVAAAQPAQGFEAELGSLAMFATSSNIWGWMNADGRTLTLGDSTAAYFAIFGCTFGCVDGRRLFNIPNATGPLSALGGTEQNPGPLEWKLASFTSYSPRDDGPRAVYPNQVFFTAARDYSRQTGNALQKLGFTALDLGEQVGPKIAAWQVPSSWPSQIDPYVGEVRLFLTGTTLPTGWIPADGRVLSKDSVLGQLLSSSGFVLNGEIQVPTLENVGNFSWAIAEDGLYPQSN